LACTLKKLVGSARVVLLLVSFSTFLRFLDQSIKLFGGEKHI
jgi:hypothetical protein